VVAQTCNPSYLGGRGLWLEASLGKKFSRPPSPPTVEHSGMCLSPLGMQEAQIEGWSGHKERPFLKHSQNKKG
jgi:hypothetical protein